MRSKKLISKESPQAEKISKQIFPVVGIGASAGGLDAFKKFIKAIPPGSGMAYILVQHLHPDHISALPEILQRETSIPVIEVSDNIEVAPDTVYIIPVNKMLVAKDGILHLSPRPSDKKNRLIDVFFSSLAEVHHNQAIGIVLSGTGTDGTDGLKKIKDEGGLTMAQDKDSAAYEEMPENAIQSEVVDFVIPPEAMPQRLLDLAKTYNHFDEEGHPPADEKNEEAAYRQILSILRISFAADFNFYKQTTIRRRIMRRMAILRIEKIAGYLKFIRQNKDEQSTLFQDLLIPVTAFFRDPGTFEYIAETVFPQLIKNKSVVNPLRIWVAGCSTGEEAYSLGMCLYEFLNNLTTSLKVQIFATDVSEFSIAKARAGIYNKRQLENVSDERLLQFFTKIDGTYQVKKIIRDMCVFASHNFLKDPPFARIDLISCRNVLIYMEPFLQKKAFSIFHYALNEKGVLLLGKSETTGASSELFEPFGKKDKLYTKKEAISSFQGIPSRAKEEILKDKDYAVQSNARKHDDFQKSADDILLSKYTPSGVIVNSQFDIVQFRGSTGPYLEPSPGKASLNILKMARYGLAFELRNALHKAKTLRKTVVKERIPLDDGKKIITIEVIPLPNTIDAHYLILFKNFDETDENKPQARAKNKKQAADDLNDAKNARIVQLEKDLALAREDMRTITEDQEAANEELQSANEELLSGSEELQSLNEELETSKEELQSTNEELVTVNQELFDRNEGYNQARLYAEAIVTAIHEPLLVLQNNFNIKSANHSFYNYFNITEKEAIGKNLFELKNNFFDIPGLQKEISKIRQEKASFVDWEVTYTFPGLGKKTICFNIQPISGQPLILFAMDDITLRKEAEKAQSIFNLRKILEFMPQIAFSATAEGMFNYFNNYFVDYIGSVIDEVKGIKWLPDVHPDQSKKHIKPGGIL